MRSQFGIRKDLKKLSGMLFLQKVSGNLCQGIREGYVKKVSIRTVAKAAGVAPSTVSLVLNNSPKTSGDTRAKVMKVVHETHYAVKMKNRRIAIVVGATFPFGPYDAAIVFSLMKHVSEAGDVPVIIRDGDMHFFNFDSFDSIITTTYNHTADATITKDFSVPVISINNFTRHTDGIYTVVADDSQAVSVAVGHLARLGHTRISMLLYPGKGNFSKERRKKAFMKILSEEPALKGRIFEPEESPGWCSLGFDGNGTDAECRRWLNDFVVRAYDEGVSAMIVPWENICRTLLNVLKCQSIRVPDDISIVCWENRGVSSFLDPPLTSLEQDYDSMARTAVSMIRKHIAGGRKCLHDVLVPYIFHKRASTSEPARK
ncbi:MAG: Lactose operon repressor [Lentisphaerae bacterium ADurb.Bin242]|nr:MAG: Lactose operon repressor [Lentisphaerae bacterium ADurb.Bin242]